MKKIFMSLLALAITLCATQALATVGVTRTNVAATCEDSSCDYGSDNATVIWTINKMTADNVKDKRTYNSITGGYFDFTYTYGNCTSVVVNFYTSRLSSGDTDWKEYMPKSATTNIPTAYNLTMPAANAAWFELIPFPELIKRAKVVFAFTDNESTCTDSAAISMTPATK